MSTETKMTCEGCGRDVPIQISASGCEAYGFCRECHKWNNGPSSLTIASRLRGDADTWVRQKKRQKNLPSGIHSTVDLLREAAERIEELERLAK